jgi:acyl transferase domain-containing protein
VAGLIKTVLALQHGQLPPSLHFHRPNPKIDFASSPFYVNDQLRDWKTGPTRAGPASVPLASRHQRARRARRSACSRTPWQVATVATPVALGQDGIRARRWHGELAEHLRNNPEINLADVAFTLQVGRKPFGHRRMAVCQSVPDAVEALSLPDPKRVVTRQPGDTETPVLFMFPGQGAQHVNMARGNTKPNRCSASVWTSVQSCSNPIWNSTCEAFFFLTPIRSKAPLGN